MLCGIGGDMNLLHGGDLEAAGVLEALADAIDKDNVSGPASADTC